MEKVEETGGGAVRQESSHQGEGQSLQHSGAASNVVCDGGSALISETGQTVRSGRDEDVLVGMWIDEERSSEE